MSIADYPVAPGTNDEPPDPISMLNGKRLHRLASVRRLQGISRRTIARRLNVDIASVKQQEAETSDLPLSVLYQWQALLEVPAAELLVDSEEALSGPVLQRARMVRIMKTVLSILERSNQPGVKRMAQNLVEQLVELMPELKGISAWHAVGQRRRLDEYGRAAERRLSRDMFFGSME